MKCWFSSFVKWLMRTVYVQNSPWQIDVSMRKKQNCTIKAVWLFFIWSKNQFYDLKFRRKKKQWKKESYLKINDGEQKKKICHFSFGCFFATKCEWNKQFYCNKNCMECRKLAVFFLSDAADKQNCCYMNFIICKQQQQQQNWQPISSVINLISSSFNCDLQF